MIGVHPWGLDPTAEEALFHALRFSWFKWDTYACGKRLILSESLVLRRDDHEQVVRIVEALHQALGRFEGRILADPDALRALDIPEAVHPLVMEGPEEALQCARYDLFATEDGRWMVSEFNEDVPGGFNEAAGIPGLLGDPGGGLHWEGDLRARFVEAFEPFGAVALLYATAYSEDPQHMLVLEKWLREAGHRTLLASPEHLEDVRFSLRGPRVLGEMVDAAFRFYPGEWMARLPNLRAWRRHGARLPMMNPVRSLVRQSKTVFALWQEDGLLSPEDRELVARHCPHTEPFRPESVERLRDERERWVLKRSFGRMGDSVVLGSLVTEREWEAALTEATREPRAFCIQKRFRVRPVAFASGPLYPAIGAYLVNGRFAGYYSRAASRPLITHEAFHVATLVRAARGVGGAEAPQAPPRLPLPAAAGGGRPEGHGRPRRLPVADVSQSRRALRHLGPTPGQPMGAVSLRPALRRARPAAARRRRARAAAGVADAPDDATGAPRARPPRRTRSCLVHLRHLDDPRPPGPPLGRGRGLAHRGNGLPTRLHLRQLAARQRRAAPRAHAGRTPALGVHGRRGAAGVASRCAPAVDLRPRAARRAAWSPLGVRQPLLPRRLHPPRSRCAHAQRDRAGGVRRSRSVGRPAGRPGGLLRGSPAGGVAVFRLALAADVVAPQLLASASTPRRPPRAGFRRSSAGGFGSHVPEPSSGSSG